MPDIDPQTYSNIANVWGYDDLTRLIQERVENMPDLPKRVATAEPSREFERFHDRQVVILHGRKEQDAWLDSDTDPEKLLKLLRPLPAGHLQFRPVGPAVNVLGSVHN